ncbi:MAG: hypothetical protein KJ600_01960 [Nanoarchaeota archaeon]|nr:hypothetical protein [Nanoarchaeota archaeon]MBU1103301.1 hypothetical protein [Nanoarchaeota archaeon]
MKSKKDNTLLVITVIAVVVSAVGLVLTWNSVYTFQRIMLSGDEGYVDVSIVENAQLDFTTDMIDWGAGYIPPGDGAETLDTIVGTASTPIGHWNRASNLPDATSGGDDGSGGFIVENIGNIDVDLTLYTSKDAADFIGGNGAEFQFQLSNYEVGACPIPQQVGVVWGVYGDVVLEPGILVCNTFNHEDTGSDELKIDIRMVIPGDADIDLAGPEDRAQMIAVFSGV